MQDKKAIAPSVLVVLIAMVVVFIILFRIDMLIVNIITGGSEDQICFWSASLSSFSRVGPATIHDLHCQRRMVNVVMDPNDIPAQQAVNDEDKTVYEYINKQIAPALRKNLAKWYNEPETSFDIKQNRDNVLKYRLNEIMARELKRCWGNLGRGTYDLFEQDLLPVGYEEGAIKPDGSILSYINPLNLELRNSPKVCKICAVVDFSSEVRSKFTGKELDLMQFLTNNPVKTTTSKAISYREFLKDDIPQSDLLNPSYSYNIDSPQAVIFLRMNMHSYIREIFGDITTLSFSQIVSGRDYKEGRILAVDMPLLIPFSAVSDNCDRFS